MGYRKRFEDAYLDKEEEEFEGDDTPDGLKLLRIIQKGKNNRNERDLDRIERLTERLFEGAKMPGIPGAQAVEGLQMAANGYTVENELSTSLETWERILTVSTEIGNSALYYEAMEQIAQVSASMYE